MGSKRFFAVLITLILLFAMTGTVFSSVTTVSESDGQTVKISGAISSGEANVPVSIDVFAPGKDYTDLEQVIENGGDTTTVLAHRYEVKSNENGTFEHVISVVDDPDIEGDALSGVYKVIVWPMDSDSSESTTFLFTNFDDMAKTFKKLKEKSSYEEVLEFLNENVYRVGVPYAFYENADKTNIAKMVFDYIKSNSFDTDSPVACAEIMKKAALIDGLTTGNVADAFDYTAELSIDNSDIKNLYKKEYAVSLYGEISKGFVNKPIESFDEFYNLLNELFILSVVKKSDGVGNVKEVIDAFEKELEIEPTSNLNVYRKIMNVSYKSLDDLVDAYKKAYKSEKDSVSNQGFGGSGGSGNSVGNYGVSADILEQEIKRDGLPLEIFTDIESVGWAKAAIVYLAEKEIVNGKGEGKFYPLDSITREEFTKIVAGAFLADEEEKELPFEDVDAEEWYVPYIKKAYNAGIITGYNDRQFGIGENITREDMVVILYRVALEKGFAKAGESILTFKDGNEIADYAKTAVASMAEMGIINGKEFDFFAPKDFASRAETAKTIYRLIMK